VSESAPSGLIVIDKPAGITSHGVVGVVRRTLGTRKVGHAGTLDPMATGVLLVGVGRATRLLGHLALHDKDYLATIRLGAATVTDDREGDVISVADEAALSAVTRDALAQGVQALTGDIDQVPTAVSAIKVDGKRAHALVRAGEQVELSARRVRIDRFDILGVEQGRDVIDVEVGVTCSTGTYVRALARDLGAMLGVGGHLTALRRTRVGGWSVGEALSLDDLTSAAHPSDLLLPLAECARRSFPVVVLESTDADWVRHGRPVGEVVRAEIGEPTAVLTQDGELLALVGPSPRGPVYLAVFVA
jgi:tRNA pseudouridine55 synthase